MRIVESSVELLSITPNAAQLIERCGRICYKSEDREITDETAAGFIVMLKKRGHVSVLEHPAASFHIVCDRGITHEIVRHRLASYSQESTRFCNYSKKKFGREIAVVRPRQIVPDSDADREWRHACADAEARYFALLDAGEKPQNARSVLPTCLKTEIAMTANFREWTHFLALRLKGVTGAPHPDMRFVAYHIWRHLVEHCPAIFDEFAEAAREFEADAGGRL